MDAGARRSWDQPAWIAFSVFGLVVMATWTLVIKFLAPLLFAAAERLAGRPEAAAPIMWDFWWVAHLALARMLWARHPLAWVAGALVAIVEIVIVAVKLALYLKAPGLSFWDLLWFTNKIYVLVFFVIFLGLLMTRGRP
jgi:hypothetical protein